MDNYPPGFSEINDHGTGIFDNDNQEEVEQQRKDGNRLKSITTELLSLVHRYEGYPHYEDSKNAVKTLILFSDHLEK